MLSRRRLQKWSWRHTACNVPALFILVFPRRLPSALYILTRSQLYIIMLSQGLFIPCILQFAILQVRRTSSTFMWRLSSTRGRIIASITLISYALRCQRSADYLGIGLKSSSNVWSEFLWYRATTILYSISNISHHSVNVFVALPMVILIFDRLFLLCSWFVVHLQLSGS